MNSMPLRRSFTAIALVLIAVLSTLIAIAAQADELPTAKATVPDNFVEVRKGLGGAYYVDARIKKRYDDLFAQVQALQADVQQARISETNAQGRIADLRKKIEAALREIQDKEIFITAATVHKKRESQTFTLGPAGVLLVKAEQVQIVGWDKPHVEAIVEKVVFSTGDKLVAADLDAIKVVHRQMTGAEALDWSNRERRAEKLQKLTPESLTKYPNSLSKYRFFARLDPEVLGKLPAAVADRLRVKPVSAQLRMAQRRPFESIIDDTIDVVELDGLSHGNSQIVLQVMGKISGRSSIVWRRHARLTLYVPKCKTVAVMGGHEGIDLESIDASVEVQMQNVPGSDVTFHATGISGSLVTRDVPWQLVERVAGDVDCMLTQYGGIESSGNYDEVRAQLSTPSEQTRVFREIGGHLLGWFVQANLQIRAVSEEVDVRNDFGNTVWTLDKPPTAATNRVVSQCGDLQLRIPNPDAVTAPITAVSEVGNVYVPDDMKQLGSVMFSTPGAHQVTHSWHGFITKTDKPVTGSFDRFRRMPKILADEPRSAGFDLVSRAGTVRILVEPRAGD